MTEEPKFQKASEYTPDELTLMTVNFQTFFQWIYELAKSNAPEGQGISVKGAIGIHSAEITYSLPPVTQSSRQRSPPKALNLAGAQGVVAEYPDLLTQAVDAGTFWFVGTKKNLGDKYQEINKKLRDNGFRYEKWDQSKSHTGGWRANK